MPKGGSYGDDEATALKAFICARQLKPRATVIVGPLLENHLFQNSYSRESSVPKQKLQGIVCGKTVILEQLGGSPSIIALR